MNNRKKNEKGTKKKKYKRNEGSRDSERIKDINRYKKSTKVASDLKKTSVDKRQIQQDSSIKSQKKLETIRVTTNDRQAGRHRQMDRQKYCRQNLMKMNVEVRTNKNIVRRRFY